MSAVGRSTQITRRFRPVITSLTTVRRLSRSVPVKEDSKPQTNVSGSGPSTAKTPDSTPVSLSSCAPNTVLTGLNYLKDQPPVLALPDEEYPPWLWNLLKPKTLQDDGPGGKAEKDRLRKTNRQRIREQNFLKTQ